MPDQTAQTKHWSGSGQLRGGASGIKFFLTVLRVLGLRFTYALLVPPAVYFSFVSPDVPATMDYHRRIFGPVPSVESALARVPAFLCVWPGHH